MKRSRALSTLSSKQVVGSAVGVVTVVAGRVAKVLEVELIKPTVAWKQEQALLTLGLANSLTKIGRTVEEPGGKARKPGQKATASAVKRSRALSTLSSKQMVGSAVAVVVVAKAVGDVEVESTVGAVLGNGVEVGVELIKPTVAWKQEQALLMLGVANSLT